MCGNTDCVIIVTVHCVQGYRTGYVYREPAVPQADEEKQVPHSEVVVPPTVSSYTYSFEEDTGRESTYANVSHCVTNVIICKLVFSSGDNCR